MNWGLALVLHKFLKLLSQILFAVCCYIFHRCPDAFKLSNSRLYIFVQLGSSRWFWNETSRELCLLICGLRRSWFIRDGQVFECVKFLQLNFIRSHADQFIERKGLRVSRFSFIRNYHVWVWSARLITYKSCFGYFGRSSWGSIVIF